MIFHHLLLLLGAFHCATQFLPPPSELVHVVGYAEISIRYKQVPAGICELDPNVKSFSGYADISPDEHSFFWFFEARDVDPTQAPLTVWVNGQSIGSSSMADIFQGVGPCSVNEVGKIENNPHSWTKTSNVLFIDQPIQVGFSYTNAVPAIRDPDTLEITPLPNATCPANAPGCGTWSLPTDKVINSTAAAAPYMWKTLQGFMGAFPQYSSHGVHFAGTRYAGHYAPVFADYFDAQNKANLPESKAIDLRSIIVGNGRFDPAVLYESYYNFTVSPGNTYDYSPYNVSAQKQLYENIHGKGKCLDRLKAHCQGLQGDDEACDDADHLCYDNVQHLFWDETGRSELDLRHLKSDPVPPSSYIKYLNTPKVQAAVGAYTNYSDYAIAVGITFTTTGDDGRSLNTMKLMRKLLDRNVSVALYAGDADYSTNWLANEKIARLVHAPGFDGAGYVNISTRDNMVHGQVKQSGKFSFARVYDSGTEVPFYQPLLAQSVFDRIIHERDVATGKSRLDKRYKTCGSKQNTYREGNGTIH